MTHRRPEEPPTEGTVERWAFDLVTGTTLAAKLDPPAPPHGFEQNPLTRRLHGPGRPPELQVIGKTPRTLGREALRHPQRRAQRLHTFLHHELQAAELMAWAILAFVDTPVEFRKGLLGIAEDEIRHMGFYRTHMRRLGFEVGDFPVRDWFWERVPQAQTPAHFVATMGLGLEGANLDHAARFAERFRAAGDEQAARIQEQVCEEEIPHVKFAAHWFTEFTGGLDFDVWAQHLVGPLTPMIMQGKPLNQIARGRAGMDEEFLTRLAQYDGTENE